LALAPAKTPSLALVPLLRYPFIVSQELLPDAAVVLIGHGSTVNARSSEPVFAQAAELRRRACFAAVHEAFWKQEPQIRTVLAAASEARLFLVPLFISEGYFSEGVIPEALGFSHLTEEPASRVQRKNEQKLIYCKAIGTHPRMTDVLLARAREVVEQNPFPRPPKALETTLFIAGHGTEQDENSRKAIEQHVELLRARNIYANVHGVFLEETPRIADYHKIAVTRNVIVVPFFISDGMHTQEDIPVLLGETKGVVQRRLAAGQPSWRNPTEKHGKLVWYSEAVGNHRLIGEIILERVREAAGWS
jgi:sirohydrochlorin cobaltochelatase